jgi:hypothetical protein
MRFVSIIVGLPAAALAFSTYTSSKAVSPSTALASASVNTVNEESSSKTMFGRFVDEEASFEVSDFPIAPNDLIARARRVLSPDVGIGTKDKGACLANDFEFVAAVVGPLDKDAYLGALENFDLETAFDIEANFYGFSVDPIQPNRVWFFNRVRGKHVGKFLGTEPTGIEVEYPPQVHHLDFNAGGLVTEYGFYTCDRRQGNTGGLGGAFGFMYAIGKPFPAPEGRPYKKSWQFRLLTWLGNRRRKD